MCSGTSGNQIGFYTKVLLGSDQNLFGSASGFQDLAVLMGEGVADSPSYP
jgi:hypothetical protein